MITQCEDCIFWVQERNNEFGQCRQKAPLPKIAGAGTGSFIGPYNYRAVWGYTRGDDGCGEGMAGKPQVVDEAIKDQTLIPETRKTPQSLSSKSFDEAVEQARKKNA